MKWFGKKEIINRVVPSWNKKEEIFDSIIGYDELKKMVLKSLVSGEGINVLFDGPAGTGKSSFLRCIEKKYGRHTKFLDCCLLTKAGLRDYLFANQNIKILLLDEISRLTKADQGVLLNLMGSGEVIDGRAGRHGRTILFKNLKIYCTSNNREKLIFPANDRMDIWYCPEYTYEQFVEIGEKILSRKIKDPNLRDAMIEAVFHTLNSTSIRDLQDLSKYVDSYTDLDEYLKAKEIHTEKE